MRSPDYEVDDTEKVINILRFILFGVMLIFSFCSAFVQFTLIKLVYILPDKFKWIIVASETLAGYLTLLLMTPIFFTTIDMHPCLNYLYAAFNFIFGILLLVLSYRYT